MVHGEIPAVELEPFCIFAVSFGLFVMLLTVTLVWFFSSFTQQNFTYLVFGFQAGLQASSALLGLT